MLTARNLRHRVRLQLAMGDTVSPAAVTLPGIQWLNERDPERAAFLNAIANNPEDAAPRLIMADWLDERGEHIPAARLRWYAGMLNEIHNDVGRFYNYGNQATQLHGTTPEVKKEWATEKLHWLGGTDALNVYHSLLRHAFNKITPVDWSAVHSLGYTSYSTHKLQREIEGVHLANELMALGAYPKQLYGTVERQGQSSLNGVNMLMPVNIQHPERPAGHVGYLHSSAHAGAEQALQTGAPSPNVGTNLSNSHFLSRILNRTHAGIAATRNYEEGGGNPDAYSGTYNYNNVTAAGLAVHPKWMDFPQENMPEPVEKPETRWAEKQMFSLRQFMRQALKLAQPEPNDTPAELPVAESFTTPEKEWVAKAPTSSQKEPGRQYYGHIRQLLQSRMKPFSATLPAVSTLTTLAELGEPVKGEYANTAKAIKHLFGHDPDGVTAWLGLNGVFSPQTSYNDHTGAAAMITAAWLHAKKPQDETTIRRLIEAVDAFGKHYTPELGNRPWQLNPKTGKYVGITPGASETFGGTTRNPMAIANAVNVLQNVKQLRAALEDPTGQAGQDLSMLGGGGTSKVPNFVVSYVHPMFGTALDTHMSRLMLHPDLDSFKYHSDILRQVRAHLPRSNQDQMDRLEAKSLQGLPIRSELVRLLMKNPSLKVSTGRGGKYANLTVSDWLKDINMRLLAVPQHYLAYKFAVNEAAKRLGWHPAEVQESVWTALIALMAGNALGLPAKEIQKYLTPDIIRKGWNNHESIYYPKLVDALRRGGANPQTLRRVGKRLSDRAAEASRPGILRVRRPSDLPTIAAHLPGVTARHAGRPIYDALRKRLMEHGLFNADRNVYQAAMPGEPLQLMAQYDRPLDFGVALDRVAASNQQPFIQGLKNVLQQSGIIPHFVAPAVHDYAGQTRASVVALGQYANPEAPRMGTAWVGLLGRQPGMLSFRGNPRGKDSIYTFHHHDASIVRNVLQEAGVPSRTIVPQGSHYQVYIYDPGNRYRTNVAQALESLKATATEWRGDGKVLGGDTQDMGRAQYRDVINQGEAQQFARPIPTLGQMLYRSVQQKPRDDARWLILADHMDEIGKPNTAAFLRMLVSTNPSRIAASAYNPAVKWIRDVTQIPGGMYRVGNINDVTLATTMHGPIPGEISLRHGYMNDPKWSRAGPKLVGGFPAEYPDIAPYGDIQLRSNPGRLLGNAVVDLPTLHGIVGEAEPRRGPFGTQYYNKKTKYLYLDYLKDHIRRYMDKKQDIPAEPAGPQSEPPEPEPDTSHAPHR